LSIACKVVSQCIMDGFWISNSNIDITTISFEQRLHVFPCSMSFEEMVHVVLFLFPVWNGSTMFTCHSFSFVSVISLLLSTILLTILSAMHVHQTYEYKRINMSSRKRETVLFIFRSFSTISLIFGKISAGDDGVVRISYNRLI